MEDWYKSRLDEERARNRRLQDDWNRPDRGRDRRDVDRLEREIGALRENMRMMSQQLFRAWDGQGGGTRRPREDDEDRGRNVRPRTGGYAPDYCRDGRRDEWRDDEPEYDGSGGYGNVGY